MATRTRPVTSNPEVNELLVTDPLALLIGMLLDQHIGETSTRQARFRRPTAADQLRM